MEIRHFESQMAADLKSLNVNLQFLSAFLVYTQFQMIFFLQYNIQLHVFRLNYIKV